MKSKDVLCNFDMEDDDDEGSQYNKTKEQQKDEGNKTEEKKTWHNKQFQSTSIKKNLLQQQDEFDYHNAAIIPASGKRVKIQLKRDKPINKKQQQRQLSYIKHEGNEKQQIKKPFNASNHPSINLLNEFNYESSSQQQEQKPQIQKNEKKQSKEKQAQKLDRQDHKVQRSNLIDFDIQSSSNGQQSDSNKSSSQSIGSNKQIKRMLSLKHNERQQVTIKDIALTHDMLENMKLFTQKTIKMDKIAILKIYRNSSGLNTFCPQFRIFLQENGAKVLIANKKMGSTSSNYYITLDTGVDSVTHELFIAKMRANFWSSIYNVYTKGVNPKSAAEGQKKRAIQATMVFYCSKERKQPRSFQVFTLAQNIRYEDLEGVMNNEQIGLNQLYHLPQNKSKIFRFINRKPIFSKAIEGYILNFGGRVQVASVKNFILEDAIAHRQALMMGKLADDVFRMDVSWPLKPYVGVCIGLANIDSTYTGD